MRAHHVWVVVSACVLVAAVTLPSVAVAARDDNSEADDGSPWTTWQPGAVGDEREFHSLDAAAQATLGQWLGPQSTGGYATDILSVSSQTTFCGGEPYLFRVTFERDDGETSSITRDLETTCYSHESEAPAPPPPDCEPGDEVPTFHGLPSGSTRSVCDDGCQYQLEGGASAMGPMVEGQGWRVSGTENNWESTGESCDAGDEDGDVVEGDGMGEACYGDGTTQMCHQVEDTECGEFGGIAFCSDQLSDGQCVWVGDQFTCAADADRVGDDPPVPAPEDRPTDSDGNPQDTEVDSMAPVMDVAGNISNIATGSVTGDSSLSGGEGVPPGESGSGVDDGNGDGSGDGPVDYCDENEEVCDAIDFVVAPGLGPFDEQDTLLPEFPSLLDEIDLDELFTPETISIPATASCPDSQSVSILGNTTLDFEYTGLCDLAGHMRPLVIGMAWVMCIFMVGRAVR